jgi:hypothetical protein
MTITLTLTTFYSHDSIYFNLCVTLFSYIGGMDFFLNNGCYDRIELNYEKKMMSYKRKYETKNKFHSNKVTIVAEFE